MTAPTADTRRRRLALVALLAVLTLAGGAWARLGAPSWPGPSTGGAAPASGLGFAATAGGPVRLAGRLDRDRVLIGGDRTLRMELLLSADALAGAPRVATDLVVVFDRSGSMQGAPLASAKGAVRSLLAQLSATDRFALVSYASGARVDLPLAVASPENRRAWEVGVRALAAGGGTDMSAGLDLGLGLAGHEAGRAARIVLLSDGHANEGDFSYEGLRARAARVVASERVLSAVGVGDGFHEQLMTALADSGAGNFYYVRRPDDLGRVFAQEFAAARSQVARGLQVTIDPAPGVEVLSAAGYPLERGTEGVAFRPGPLFGGQERRIWVTMRVPDSAVEGLVPAAVRLAYERDGARRQLEARLPRVVAVADVQRFEAGIDRDAWAASVVDEEMGALQQRVSGALSAGRVAEARELVGSFVANARQRNERFQAPAVTAVVEEAEAMLDEVDAVAASPPARAAYGKQLSADGYDKRRQGAKYGKPDAGDRKSAAGGTSASGGRSADRDAR